METDIQKTIYYPDRINRILASIVDSYLISKGGRENPNDGFMDFINLLRNFISDDLREHYTYKHIKTYAETIRYILGKKCNEIAFDAVSKSFDFYGKG